MKKRFMGISLVMALSVTLALIYWFYPHTNPPISSSVISSQEKNTGMVSGSSVSGSSVLVPEVSGSTISGSGSQTGSIVSHSSLLVKFQKPNTEWKERDVTLSDGRTLHYVFGEGNPKEVALDKEGIKQYMSTIDPETGNTPYGYMTSNSEMAMEYFLDDPKLEDFIEKCSYEIDWNNTRREVLHDWEKYPNDLRMEKFLSVNEKTGLKEWDWNAISRIDDAFNTLDSPISTAWQSCMNESEYQTILKPLHARFSAVIRGYLIHD